MLGSTDEFLANVEDDGRISISTSNEGFDIQDEDEDMFRAQSQSRVGKIAKDRLFHLVKPQMCLITCEKMPLETLQIVHLIPRSADDRTLRALEYAFDIPYKSFHVDSTKNLIILRADMHISFDNKGWALLPEARVVDEMAKRAQTPLSPNDNRYPNYKESFPGVESFKYTLLPLGILQDNISIFRRRWSNHDQDSTGPLPPEYDAYNSPFDDFPKIKSHVSPFYVIANTGAKLQTSFVWVPKAFRQRAEAILFLYSWWMTPPPLEWLKEGHHRLNSVENMVKGKRPRHSDSGRYGIGTGDQGSKTQDRTSKTSKK